MKYIIKLSTRAGNTFEHIFDTKETVRYYWKNAASKYDLDSFRVEVYKDGRLVAIYGRRFGRA